MSWLAILGLIQLLLPILEWFIKNGGSPGFIVTGMTKRVLRRINSSDFTMTPEQSVTYGAQIERFKQLASQLGISADNG